MYSIYFKNMAGDNAMDHEELVYSIPIRPEDQEYVFTDPMVAVDFGKTGTFEYTIQPNHPYYHIFQQMQTLLRVDYDGDTIFRGRILTFDNTINGAKKVHCEGDMSFFLDSIQAGTKEVNRTEITLLQYITNLINSHNEQMAESGNYDKCFELGELPGRYSGKISAQQQITNEKKKFGSDSHQNTKNALDALTKEYGGYLRTRYENGVCYLDWLKNWFNNSINSQPIALTQNIIDVNSSSQVENIFTAVIPLGSKGGEAITINGYKTDIHGANNERILVPQITKVFSESELNNGYATKAVYENAINQYGIIYVIQKFENADTQEKLWEYACDWIKNNYVGGITTYDLDALDMHHVNGTVAKYLLGDRVKLTIPKNSIGPEEKIYRSPETTNIHESLTINRTLVSIKYNLHNPEKNSYGAGIPNDIADREYGVKASNKKGGGGGGGGGGGNPQGDKNEAPDPMDARQKAMEELAWKFVYDQERNPEAWNTIKQWIDRGGEDAKVSHDGALVAAQQIVAKVLNDGITDEKQVIPMIYMNADDSIIEMNNQLNEELLEAKAKIRMDPDGPTPSKPIDLKKWQATLKTRGFLRARTALIMGAASDAIEYNKKNGASVSVAGTMTEEQADAILDVISDTDISGAETEADATKMLNDALEASGLTVPEPVAEIAANVVNGNGDLAGVLKLGSDQDKKTDNVELGGGNGGTADIGRDSTTGKRLVRINKPLTYTVGDKTYRVPEGTIDAKDFAAIETNVGNPINSFTTKFAAVDTFMANQIIANRAFIKQGEFEELVADVAELEEVVTNKIDATYLSTYFGTARELHASSFTVDNAHFKVGSSTVKLIQIQGMDGQMHTVLGVS